MEDEDMNPFVLDLDIRWRRVVSFTFQPLHPRKKWPLPIVGLREGFLMMERRERNFIGAGYLPEIVKNAVNALWSVLFNDAVSC